MGARAEAAVPVGLHHVRVGSEGGAPGRVEVDEGPGAAVPMGPLFLLGGRNRGPTRGAAVAAKPRAAVPVGLQHVFWGACPLSWSLIGWVF